MLQEIQPKPENLNVLIASLNFSFSVHYTFSLLGKVGAFRPINDTTVPPEYFNRVGDLQLAFNHAAIFNALQKKWTLFIPRPKDEDYDDKTFYLLDELLKSRMLNRNDSQKLVSSYNQQGEKYMGIFRFNVFTTPEAQDEYNRILEELNITDINTAKVEDIFEKILLEEDFIF